MLGRNFEKDELLPQVAACLAFGIPKIEIAHLVQRNRNTVFDWIEKHGPELERLVSFIRQLRARESSNAIERYAKKEEELLDMMHTMKKKILESEDLRAAVKLIEIMENRLRGVPKTTVKHEGSIEHVERHVLDVPPQVFEALNSMARRDNRPPVIDVPLLPEGDDRSGN
jgi:hypothetical protein